jgi:hypothetical protein
MIVGAKSGFLFAQNLPSEKGVVLYESATLSF